MKSFDEVEEKFLRKVMDTEQSESSTDASVGVASSHVLEPASDCNSINNNINKKSTELLFSYGKIAGSPDSANGSGGSKPVISVSALPVAAINTDVCSVSSMSAGGLLQTTQNGDEGGIGLGPIASEPAARVRFVALDGSNGTVFACSRCNKQYIHRKSLNKHWHDKHAGKSKSLAPLPCSASESHVNVCKHVAVVHCASGNLEPSCSYSLSRSAVGSGQICSPTYAVKPRPNSVQRKYNEPANSHSQRKCSGSVRDSVLWHSLSAIHPTQEPDRNSFCCAPMPAHIGGCSNARGSYFSNLLFEDECQVLDLSKNSSDVYEWSSFPVSDSPLDLSVHANNAGMDDSENNAWSASNFVEHGSTCTSASNYCTGASMVSTPSLSQSAGADGLVAQHGVIGKDRKLESDAVAILRQLHSGMLVNTINRPVSADTSIRSVSLKSKLNYSGAAKKQLNECPPASLQSRNELITSTKESRVADSLATAEETHEFFGGISRGGHVQCKVCDFSAVSMILFSQHVVQHVKKTSYACHVQGHHDNRLDKSESEFFVGLGLLRSGETDKDKTFNDRGHCGEVSYSITDENAEVRCKAVVENVCEVSSTDGQAGGFGNHYNGESRVQSKDGGSDSVRQRSGRYQRGLGLTTTESADAAGRSWRRRRLRRCDRCGYITDNLTTLKRHEVKHGALGLYRCAVCDYTVNQQHILEYHMRSVHRLLGPAAEALRDDTAVQVAGNPADNQCEGSENTGKLIGVGTNISCCKDSSGGVSISDNGVSEDSGIFVCGSEVSKMHRYSKQKVRSKDMQNLSSVTVARRNLLDRFVLQLGHGVCVRCGFRSLSNVRMKLHMLQHPSERHACSLCLHTSLTRWLHLKHKQQHGRGCLAQKKTYQCSQCPFIAASSSRLQCHTQFHGVQLRHTCDKCSYSVDRANLMVQHRRLHKFPETYVESRCWLHCEKCPFGTISRASLVNHERGHYATNCRYVCSFCGFATNVTNVAFHHQRLHSRVNKCSA